MTGTRLESVSMGKGTVHWKIVLPPLSRRPRGLSPEYDELQAACEDLKRFFRREDVDNKAASLADEKAPDTAWGSESA